MAVEFHIGKAVREKQLKSAQELPDVAKPAKPGIVTQGWSYAKASARWVAAGMPVRGPEEQAAILQICRGCPRYEPHPKKPDTRPGSCGLCGCKLSIRGDKLRWATESCPDNPPRWGPAMSQDAVVAQDVPAEKAKPSRQERRAARDARIAARKARKEAQAREVAARALPGGLPVKPPQAAQQPPQPSKADRKKAKAERIENRRLSKLAMGGVTPPKIDHKETADPLLMYDRKGEPIGHCLRDMWHGSAGFFVCGGPSLKTLDLSFLKERGIVSLGINNVGGYAPVRAWTFSDPAEKFHHGIFMDPAIMKFVPRPKLGNRVRAKMPDGSFQWTRYEARHCPNVFAYDRETKFDANQFLTTTWATWGPSKKHPENEGKPTVLFTFFLGLRLLHYLGVRRVYLLGVDFKMDADHHYAFGQDRHPGAQASNNNSYRVASMLLHDLRPVFERAGFEVYQTNEQSGLRVFDYIPLETAIEDCRGVVPKEPFDMTGYYEKIDPKGQPDKNAATDDRGE